MKKLLLTMACAAFFGFAQAAEVTEVLIVDNFGIEKETTYQDVTYTSSTTGITYAGNMCKANKGNGNGMQFRTTSGKEAGLVATANPNNYKIVSVTVTPSSGPSTTNQWDVYGNTSAYTNFKNLYDSNTAGDVIGNGTTTATVTAASDYNFFGFRANKNAIYIAKIEITYTEGGSIAPDTRADAGLSFPEAKYTAALGEDFAEPTLTKATTAAVTYSSDAEKVATVDAATGAVTLVGVGTAKITARAEANDQYKAGEASYLLTVEDPAIANALYSGLIDNGDDWTIDNGTLPEGLTYIWKWDSQYKYMKASAFKSGSNYAASATVTSPVIDLTGCTDVTLSFEHVGNFFKGNMQNDVKVLISVDGGEFTDLAVAPWPEADAWKPWVKATADLGAYEGKRIQVRFLYTSTAERAGTWEIKTFLVNGTNNGGSVTLADAGLSFPEARYTATLGEEFTEPTLTKATTAAVTYSSDAEEVATVDAATGAVTLVGVGTARITARAEANDQYKAGEASYLLTVKAAAPDNAVLYSPMGEDFTFETTDEFQAWTHDSKYGLKGSAYKNGINATTSYAVSPVIDLNGISEAKLNYQQAFNQYKINNELIDVANLPQYVEIVVREEGSTEWTKLATPTIPESFSWNFYANEEISLAAYANKKIQLGYKYISTTECAGTWEVKEIAVTGVKNTQGVADVEIADENVPAVYYNLQGVRVDNPENGLYIKVQGKKSSKVYVK